MKPQSIVVVLSLPNTAQYFKQYVKWMPTADKKTPYVINNLSRARNSSNILASFEEGIIGHGPDGIELGLDIRHLREIMPPDNIKEVMSSLMEEPITQ